MRDVNGGPDVEVIDTITPRRNDRPHYYDCPHCGWQFIDSGATGVCDTCGKKETD